MPLDMLPIAATEAADLRSSEADSKLLIAAARGIGGRAWTRSRKVPGSGNFAAALDTPLVVIDGFYVVNNREVQIVTAIGGQQVPDTAWIGVGRGEFDLLPRDVLVSTVAPTIRFQYIAGYFDGINTLAIMEQR